LQTNKIQAVMSVFSSGEFSSQRDEGMRIESRGRMYVAHAQSKVLQTASNS
jgi:hypothetical protein